MSTPCLHEHDKIEKMRVYFFKQIRQYFKYPHTILINKYNIFPGYYYPDFVQYLRTFKSLKMKFQKVEVSFSMLLLHFLLSSEVTVLKMVQV